MAEKKDKLASLADETEMTVKSGKRKTKRAVKDLSEGQKALIIQKLNINDWNVAKTAREMAMTPRQLDYLVRTHGLRAFTNPAGRHTTSRLPLRDAMQKAFMSCFD